MNAGPSAPNTDSLYFRQILLGRDVAQNDPFARQMVNFTYAIGDRSTGECLLVDPAYDVDAIIALVGADGMRATGVLVTHYHADHVGGSLFGHTVEGITALLGSLDVPVHVNAHEAEWIRRSTGVGASHLAQHGSGDVVRVGNIDVTLLHTPGHTPGSQCFLVDDRLVAGDTLFLQGCGRTDFPGGNPTDMFGSLRRLAALPERTELYPGHLYSPAPHAPLADVLRTNHVLQIADEREWLGIFG
jgi:glyoxylase-like metal-dependent hydrolase (beta-lactamase superfamily II)